MSPPAPNVPPLILNDSSEYYVTHEDFARWEHLYPAVNVAAEIRKMSGWLEANPRKRKTRRGIKAFVNSWLAREQDKGRRASPACALDAPSANKHLNPRQYEEFVAPNGEIFVREVVGDGR